MAVKITTRGTSQSVGRFAFNLSDDLTALTLTDAAIQGRAVMIDPTSNDAVKLATDGAQILGVIVVSETDMRGDTVVTVDTMGGVEVPVAAGQTATRGLTPVGAGLGFIKSAASLTNPRIFISSTQNIGNAVPSVTVMFV
jgi:hypothetical protein